VESADEPLEPTDLFQNGPYLHVALSDDLRPIVPLNASTFIREWEHSLDPVELLRFAAMTFLSGQGWLVADCFVVPSWQTMPTLRAAPTDEGLIQAFVDTDGDLRWEEGDSEGESLRDLVVEAPTGTSVLTSTAQPVLLGLAVAATLDVLIGKAGTWLRGRWDADEEDREKRRPVVRHDLSAREAARYARDHTPDYPPE
jgi:hypothetical protein